MQRALLGVTSDVMNRDSAGKLLTRLVIRQLAEPGQRARCPDGMAHGMDAEAVFVGALPKVKHWKILGQHLELSDEDGRRRHGSKHDQ